jgi:hypothetical protein
MKNVMRAVCGFALAACLAPAAMAAVPGKVLQTAVVDGFTVNVLRFPTVARLPLPKTMTGDVTVGTDVVGTNPYTGSSLAGSPYLVMDNGGAIAYKIKNPADWVAFIWGTPDYFNIVTLYDASGNVIGTLNGADIQYAFGFHPGQYMQIISPTPVAKVSATSSTCCFEIGNQTSGHLSR